MAEKDQIGSRSVRMTTEEITGRGFASKVRGISETEVRSFLRRVAEEVERLGQREDELLETIGSLKDRLAQKPKATKAELLEILGEQTTKVLSSAEEAAEQMVRDAKQEAERIMDEAKTHVEEMTSNARARSEEKISEATSRVKNLQESSLRDAEIVIKEARTKGREIFQESVVVREKILKDLLRRRDLLLEQIEELRHGREELLESYKVVKDSFQKATDALQGVEEKASGELMSHTIDVDELLKTPVELPEILDANAPIVTSMDDEVDSISTSTTDRSESTEVQSEDLLTSSAKTKMPTITGKTQSDEETQKRKGIKTYMKDALGVGTPAAAFEDSITEQDVPESVKIVDTHVVKAVPKGKQPVKETKKETKDVGALFKSIKSHTEEDPKITGESSVSSNLDSEVVSHEVTPTEDKSEATNVSASSKPNKKKKSPKKDPVALRDDALSSVTTTILRKAKRQLQDEQNELLDALRTIKPKKQITAENILPASDTQVKNWEELISAELEEVFIAGAAQVSKEKVSYDDDVFKSAVNWIVTPLRETMIRAIDEGDQSEAAARVGARYREWRSTELKNALYDALSSAYNHGVLSAAKSDATLKWTVTKAGQCPDCDDNALEPTKAFESFPTGQVAPPAHAGCRCVLTIA